MDVREPSELEGRARATSLEPIYVPRSPPCAMTEPPANGGALTSAPTNAGNERSAARQPAWEGERERKLYKERDGQSREGPNGEGRVVKLPPLHLPGPPPHPALCRPAEQVETCRVRPPSVPWANRAARTAAKEAASNGAAGLGPSLKFMSRIWTIEHPGLPCARMPARSKRAFNKGGSLFDPL